MNLLQTIKQAFIKPDPFNERIKDLLKIKETLMLDQLASLFSDQPLQNVSQILSSVSNFVQFIEQKVEGDSAKVNQIIDHVKAIFDSHKK